VIRRNRRNSQYSFTLKQFKKICKIFLCTLVLLLVFTSCKKNDRKEPFHNQTNNRNTEDSSNHLEEQIQDSTEMKEIDEMIKQDQINKLNKAEQENEIDPEYDVERDNSAEQANGVKSIIDTVVNNHPIDSSETIINPDGQTIKERFRVLEGYKRIKTEEGTFASFLQNLSLKPEGSKVKYYDGRTKNKNVYLAVVDYPLGNRDLQQCADVVIRLRAEYLYENHKYKDIHFNFVSGFNAEFSKWSSGKGITVNGNEVSWTTNLNNNESYESFQKYLDMVYAYASTLSLDQELNPKSFADITIGDVFIQAGSPGHCVIVVDLAINETTGDKIFMLAQGYMPAQDIQILIGDEEESPWFHSNVENDLITPEWSFKTSDLKT
jgi:hypothetical protein